MSISYCLELATTASIEDIIQRVLTGIDYSLDGPDEDGEWLVRTDSFKAGIKRLYNPTDASSSPFGIVPTIRIYFFDVASTLEREIGYESILSAVVRWLSQSVEDAALLYNGAIPLLVRKEAKLIRNRKDDVWTAEGLALITIPHEIRDLPIAYE